MSKMRVTLSSETEIISETSFKGAGDAHSFFESLVKKHRLTEQSADGVEDRYAQNEEGVELLLETDPL